MKSQTERILKQLEIGNVIGEIWGRTVADPFILRVASRINDLKNDGHKIVTIRKIRKDGSLSPTAEYVLKRFFDKNVHKEFFHES